MDEGMTPDAATGRLIEQRGERAGKIHLLGAAITTIGRDERGGIVVPNAHVSLRHAQIAWDGTAYVLSDLGSTNGTFLNGRRITGPQPLQPGDVVMLAGLPDLSFVLTLTDKTTPVVQDRPASGPVRIDLRTAEVWVEDRRVVLTAKEYLAVALLHEAAGALVSKETLAVRVWPEYDGAVSDEAIGQLIARLRQKLEPEPARPRYLHTVRGLGYRLTLT